MSTPDFKEVTDGCINGNGIFDELMRSAKAHLKEEYDEQRIRGAEYTAVYTTFIQGAMVQAIQWSLGAETAKNQAKLIEKQIEGQHIQNEILAAQLDQTLAQTELLRVQKDNAIEEGKLIPKQGNLLDEQIDGAGLQNQMITQQTLTEEQNTLNAIENVGTTKFNLEQVLPVQKEIYEQKVITEQAQTQDSGNNGAIEGVTGAQRELYKKQKDGFDRDAEQKAARAITDTYGVVIASDVSGDSVPEAVSKTNINTLLTNLRSSANI